MKNNLIKLLKILVPTLMVVISFKTHAVELLFTGGILSGNHGIVSLQNSRNTKFNLNSGAGYFVSVGFHSQLYRALQLRTTIGYVRSNLMGRELNSNTPFEYVWSHIPLDFLVFIENADWITGVGLTAHINPELTASGYVAGNGIKYDTALGIISEIDYRFQKDFFAGVSITAINYSGNDGSSAAGLSLGLSATFTFDQ